MKRPLDYPPSFTTDAPLYELLHLPETPPLYHALEQLEQLSDPNIILAHLIKALRDLKRLPKWYDETKENNAEHSYMVSVFASKYLQDFYPNDPELDEATVKNFAEFHDWVEILVGDTVTLGMNEADYAVKAAVEEEALHALLAFLQRKGLTREAEALETYEKQDTKAARFVKAVDKIMTKFVNIVGDGVSARVEHKIYTIAQLEAAYAIDRERFASRFGKEFPELQSEYDRYLEQSVEQFRQAVDTTYDRDGTPIQGLGHYVI